MVNRTHFTGYRDLRLEQRDAIRATALMRHPSKETKNVLRQTYGIF